MATAEAAGGERPRAVPVTRELMRGAAQAAAEGFLDNEIWVWMLPREWQRRRLLPRHYRAMIRTVYMPRSAAWTTPDTAGTEVLYADPELDFDLPGWVPPPGTAPPRGPARWTHERG